MPVRYYLDSIGSPYKSGVLAQAAEGLLPGLTPLVDKTAAVRKPTPMEMLLSGRFLMVEPPRQLVIYQASRGGEWQIALINDSRAQAVRNHEEMAGVPRGYDDGAPWPEVTDTVATAELYRRHLNDCRTRGSYTPLPTHHVVAVARRSLFSALSGVNDSHHQVQVPLDRVQHPDQLLAAALLILAERQGGVLDRLRLAGVDLSDSSFADITFDSCDFRKAKLRCLDFTDCRMRSCDFTDTSFTDCRAVGGDWRSSNLDGAMPGGLQFYRTKLISHQLSTGLQRGFRFVEITLARTKTDITLIREPIRLTPAFGGDYEIILLDQHLIIGCQLLKISSWLTASRQQLRAKNKTLRRCLDKKTYAKLRAARPALAALCAYHDRLRK